MLILILVVTYLLAILSHILKLIMGDVGLPYQNVDEQALWKAADSSLLHYGTSWFPEIITRTEGVYLYTPSGRKILDWTSGQMSCLIGHGHPEIVETVREHSAHLDHLFSGMLSPPVIGLAEKLTSLLPEGLDKAMFLSTGGESNEAAIKMAKTYTGKFEIVGLGSSWHGMTGGALGAQYHSGRTGHGPLVHMHQTSLPPKLTSPFRSRVVTNSPLPTPTAPSSATPTAPTTGKQNSTTAGLSSTGPPAAPSPP